MKKILIVFCAVLLICNSTYGQGNAPRQYNRSSLYSVLLVDPNKRMSQEIINSFLELPVPDKFNDHNLSLRYVVVAKKDQKSKDLEENLSDFIYRNRIPKRMVAKWFNRNLTDGSFDVSTIMERGFYNASASDISMAMKSQRGYAMLSDAGEQLIGNSFLIVNSITYVDKEQNAQIAAGIFSLLGAAFGAAGGSIGGLGKSVSNLAQSVSKTVAGFTVKVNTLLYQLEWNDEIANTFYSQYYYDKTSVDESKKLAFENEKDLFKLKYIGSVSATSEKTVMRGLKRPEEVFRKVLARAIDKNIVALQKEFDVFKVVVPVYQVQNSDVLVQIGLKEGVSANSKYEVLERVEDAEGNISYQRKGVIKPVVNKIWDNRYMAVEEEAVNANLNYTTFEVVSGTGFYPGMLVREIKF